MTTDEAITQLEALLRTNDVDQVVANLGYLYLQKGQLEEKMRRTLIQVFAVRLVTLTMRPGYLEAQ